MPVGDTKDVNPRLTPDQLELILKETARPMEKTGTLKQLDVARAISRGGYGTHPRSVSTANAPPSTAA